MTDLEKMKHMVDNLSNSRSRTPKSQCPECHRMLDMACTIAGPKLTPKVGDYTICMYCNNILEFGESLVLRPVTDSTLEKIAGTEQFVMNNQLASILQKQIKNNKKNKKKRKEKNISLLLSDN